MATTPLHQFQFGHVRASIWANPATHGAVYHTTFQRLYRDEDGDWQPANGFRTLDLPVLAFTADEVYRWLNAREEAIREQARKSAKATAASVAPREGNGHG